MNKKEESVDKEMSPLTPEESEALWESVFVRIRKLEQKKRWKQLGIIASLLLFFGIIGFTGYEWYIRPEVYLAEAGPMDLKLKDGTEIKLMKGAKLTVDKSFPSETRDVSLEGSAIFRVTKWKGHPFIVHSGVYETKVFGTVFKVVEKRDAFQVELYEGKVAISNTGAGKEVYYLRPNETFNNYGSLNAAAISPIQSENAASLVPDRNSQPKTLDLQFNECRLGDIIKVIEQAYHVHVDFPEEYSDKTISIRFKDGSSDEILSTIAFSLHLQVKYNDNRYQLEK